MTQSRWFISRGLLPLLVATAVWVTACGGVDSGGTGATPASQSTSVGSISGFGSVIVNDVRYDDSAAIVVDEDGVTRSREDLRLGLVVEVDGLRTGEEGVARRIQYGQELAGPVESVDAGAQRLVVLGQTVQLSAETLVSGYAGGSGIGQITRGDLLEVSAFQNATTGAWEATRVERKTSLSVFKLRGRISGLAALPARTFSIGAALIDYGSVPSATLPALSNGLAVRVSLQVAPVSGRWVASAVRRAERSLPDNVETEIEGYVSAFVDSAHFQVNGVAVDASAPNLRVRQGSLSNLANGVRVEVEGVMRNGVLMASDLQFKTGGGGGYDLHGDIESISTGAQTFVVRGVTVTWDANTVFAAGRSTDLRIGASVHVKANPTQVGGPLLARQVRFER